MAEPCMLDCSAKKDISELHEKMDKVVIYMERLDAVLKFMETSPKYVLTLFKLGGIVLVVSAAIWGLFHKVGV